MKIWTGYYNENSPTSKWKKFGNVNILKMSIWNLTTLLFSKLLYHIKFLYEKSYKENFESTFDRQFKISWYNDERTFWKRAPHFRGWIRKWSHNLLWVECKKLEFFVTTVFCFRPATTTAILAIGWQGAKSYLLWLSKQFAFFFTLFLGCKLDKQKNSDKLNSWNNLWHRFNNIPYTTS